VTLSAGGLAPLRAFVRGLPSGLPAAVVIAQHAAFTSILADILATDSRLPVISAHSDLRLRPGVVYVCPADRHVVINPDATISLSQRERIPFRPSGDWLFESAAASFRERVVALVLSGCLNDGARGAPSVRAAGGKVVVQDPLTCDQPQMPEATIATGSADVVTCPDAMASVVASLVAHHDLARCRRAWDDPFGVLPPPPARAEGKADYRLSAITTS
jgi:two-component system, chemotaxis family, protein-glutamate methylesterase/glutaminase